jgi:FdhE protein
MTGLFAQPVSPTATEPPRLRLPAASLFAERAARLRELAAGHALEPFLRFLTVLAEAQQTLLEELAPAPLPDAHSLEQAFAHRMPPLSPAGLPLDPAWRALARALVERAGMALPEEGRQAIGTLAGADDASLDGAAQHLLGLRQTSVPPAWTPFVAAALEVYWVRLALTLGETRRAQMGGAEPLSLCPVCGSHPVAAVVQIGPEQGLRYLHCSLCNSEWHFVRAQCSNCGDARALSYFGIEGRMPWVQAEACEACGSYLKVMRRDREPHLDAVADDVASLALDLLMDEKNLARSGPNAYHIQS